MTLKEAADKGVVIPGVNATGNYHRSQEMVAKLGDEYDAVYMTSGFAKNGGCWSADGWMVIWRKELHERRWAEEKARNARIWGK